MQSLAVRDLKVGHVIFALVVAQCQDTNAAKGCYRMLLQNDQQKNDAR